MRHQIRLFFPKLYRENMPPKIDPEDIALIYDQAIHPAIRKLMPESLARWPASYAVAFAASKDSRGQIHYQSVDVPEALLGRFARHVRAALNRFPRFEDSVFQIEIRGTKGAYSFPFNDADAREYAFNLFIERLDNTRMGPHDNYYVDIGVEIHHDGHCVQWLDAAHQRLLAHALPSASSAAISALSRSSKMHKDISGHLFDLSGFRVETGTKGTADKVVYVNVYTTDKAVTYQLHDGIFRERRASELFPGPFPHLIDDINSISHTFAVCAGSQGTTQDGTARYELRVKMSNVDTALTTFPHELVQLSVVSIPNDIWWLVQLNCMHISLIANLAIGPSNIIELRPFTTFSTSSLLILRTPVQLFPPLLWVQHVSSCSMLSCPVLVTGELKLPYKILYASMGQRMWVWMMKILLIWSTTKAKLFHCPENKGCSTSVIWFGMEDTSGYGYLKAEFWKFLNSVSCTKLPLSVTLKHVWAPLVSPIPVELPILLACPIVDLIL